MCMGGAKRIRGMRPADEPCRRWMPDTDVKASAPHPSQVAERQLRHACEPVAGQPCDLLAQVIGVHVGIALGGGHAGVPQ